jgi:hypothetical protein
VDSAGQAGGYSSRTTHVPESLSDFSRPWNKNTPKTQPTRKENPTQNLTKQLQTDQELTSNTEIVLTVYFGAPSMFITLWFGFDYGTNPPLGILII